MTTTKERDTLRKKPLSQHLLPTRPDYRAIDHLHKNLHDDAAPLLRPSWRGRQHALAFLVFLPLVVWLLVSAYASTSFLLWSATTLYALALLAVLAISAIYHLFTRTPTTQLVFQRIDRSAIYLLIAGTYTPVILIALSPPASLVILSVVWLAAIGGIVLRSTGILPVVAGVLYVAIGWVALAVAPSLWSHSLLAFILIAAGGVAFTVGAILFALRIPRLSTNHYGYHELFHSFTLAGVAFHYIAVAVLLFA